MERDPADRFQNVAELAEALTPLDDWTSESEVERIRRQLDATETDVSSYVRRRTSSPRPSRNSSAPAERVPVRRRRGFSLLLACALFLPALALLPRVAQAPELATARAWSAQAVHQARATWQAARVRAQELWAKTDGRTPGEP